MVNEKLVKKILKFLNEKHFSGDPMHYFTVDEIVNGAKLDKININEITGTMLFLYDKGYVEGLRTLGVAYPIGIYITSEGIEKLESYKNNKQKFKMPESTDWTKRGIIIGICISVVTILIGMWWTSYVAENTPTQIIQNGNDELDKLKLDQDILNHYDSHKPYSIVWTNCGLSESTYINGTKTWTLQIRPIILDKDSDEALIPFNTIFTFSSQMTDGNRKEYSSLPDEPEMHPITTKEQSVIQLEMNELFEKTRKFTPSAVTIMLEKDGFAPVSLTTGNNLKVYEKNNDERAFVVLVYLPDLDTWSKSELDKDVICQNLHQK